MVDFRHLRDMAVEPLHEFAGQARKMASELERFNTETDRQRLAIAEAWSGLDASAADRSLVLSATDYRKTSEHYGQLDTIITTLADELNAARQTLESAIANAPSIPGTVNDAGTVRVNVSALGSNPAPAAVKAAELRARQVAAQIRAALQAATNADRKADTALKAVHPQPPRKLPTTVHVGDLTLAQLNNAETIVDVGTRLGMSDKGKAIALATALQESNLRNLANTRMPDSLTVPNEGVGKDHDSVGLFQQRPSQGWGTIRECMDPDHAATAFYNELNKVKKFEDLDLTVAAQRVQRSAYPDAYAKWESLANEIVQAKK
ncbi:hypothetical protein Afil01_57910 [Actinorhabdospora filicis]|uniref:Uncharacterized protein n=1 Tax=Actinorhabdospora filicis TaxID=1785913 RepID=A0A9W6SQA3_9ACTN|nr:hypothetical protein [Actinorhabdospora filicis]GLZ80984.1 hypothetical protein Afil01_57910 [Actinorhabdospora filicis]